MTQDQIVFMALIALLIGCAIASGIQTIIERRRKP